MEKKKLKRQRGKNLNKDIETWSNVNLADFKAYLDQKEKEKALPKFRRPRIKKQWVKLRLINRVINNVRGIEL